MTQAHLLNHRILGHKINDGILKKGCGVGCIPNMEGETKRKDDLIYISMFLSEHI